MIIVPNNDYDNILISLLIFYTLFFVFKLFEKILYKFFKINLKNIFNLKEKDFFILKIWILIFIFCIVSFLWIKL